MSEQLGTFFRYLANSSGDRRWGLYVPTAGYSWTPPHSPSYPLKKHPSAYHFDWEQGRILDEFQLIYIIRGDGWFESAAHGRMKIRAGDTFLLFPGVWHRYAPNPETGWDEYWIGFDGQVPRQLFKEMTFHPARPVFSPGLGAEWHDLFTRAIEVLEIESPGHQQIMAGVTYQMLTRLHAMERGETKNTPKNDSIVRKAKYLIIERIADKIAWQDLARELGVSYSSMRHVFRHYTGISPHQYQLQLRLNKARCLLNDTSDSVKSIASAVGFECPYHFSHLFKRKIGRSPEEWRHNIRGGGWVDRND